MKNKVKRIIVVMLVFVIVTAFLCACTPEIYQTNEDKTTEQVHQTDEEAEQEHTAFCDEQKLRLDNYLEENPHLSLLDYTVGTDNESSIKLVAVCYNKNTNMSSNLVVISDNETIVGLTIGDGTEEFVYLNEYPIIIYSDNKLEIPLYHYDTKEMVFHRIECTFDKEMNSAHFKVLEEAKERINL